MLLVSQMQPVVLFNNWDNPLSSGATLSEDVQNFKRVELMLRTDDGDAITVAINDPSKQTNVVASCVKYNPTSGNLFAKSKTFNVNGKSISTQQISGSYSCAQRNLTTGQQSFGDYIAVVKVTGWR